MTEPTVPTDLNDDAAWGAYCAALPAPTDGELAAVMAEFHNPYAEQIADCHEGFRTSARMLWQKRAGLGTPLTFAYLRDAMRTYAACGRTYQALAEAAAYSALSRMHLAASVEGADAYVVTFGAGD